MVRNWLRDIRLSLASCVVVGDVHGFGAGQHVAEDLRVAGADQELAGGPAPLRRTLFAFSGIGVLLQKAGCPHSSFVPA